MATPTKLATCCYCSSRTLLKPTARDGHELACGSCGAPLHEMKWLKQPEPARKPRAVKKMAHDPARKFEKSERSDRAQPVGFLAGWGAGKKVRKRPKRGKSLFSKVLEEAWDVVEDLID